MTTPIWIYDKNEILRLILEPEGDVPYWNGEYVEQLNGQVFLTFDMPADHPKASLVEGDGRAVIRDQDGNFVEFIIRQPFDRDSDQGPIKSVYAEGADYELIDEWITGYTQAGIDLKTALSAILQGTRWSVGEVYDFGVESVDLKDVSVKNGIHQLINLFGGELRYRIEKKGNTIVERYIDILDHRGVDTGKRFEMGKDILSAAHEPDTTNIKTALYGRGESQINDGPRITFANVEWIGPEDGGSDPVTKPLGQTWVGDPEALREWGYEQGKRHRWGMYDGQESDPGALLLATWNDLQKRNKPNTTYEFDVILLENIAGYSHEKVRLGDIVYAVDHRIHPNIAVQASIIEFRQNLNEITKSKVKMGSFRNELNIGQRLAGVETDVHRNRGNWTKKETPEGAQTKADAALSTAQDNIDAANARIDQTQTDLANQKIEVENYAETVSDQAQQAAENYAEQYAQDNAIIKGTLYNGVSITGSDGFLAQRSDKLVQAILNATHGLTIQTRKKTSDSFASKLYADTEGGLHLAGILEAAGGSFAGALQAASGTFAGTLQAVDGTFIGTLESREVVIDNPDFATDGFGKIIMPTGFYDLNQYKYDGDFTIESSNYGMKLYTKKPSGAILDIGYFQPGESYLDGRLAIKEGMAVGQTNFVTNYSGTFDGANDLVVNGQFSARGIGGAEMYKLAIGKAAGGGQGDLDVAGEIYNDGWFRSRGNKGWYSQDHGGGWFMQDGTWIRAYNNKNVYTTGEIRAGEFTTINSEVGRCGVGVPGNGLTGSAGLVVYPWRTRKTYTPSSISFTTSRSNNVPPNATRIYDFGWTFYIQGDGRQGLILWDGDYTA